MTPSSTWMVLRWIQSFPVAAGSPRPPSLRAWASFSYSGKTSRRSRISSASPDERSTLVTLSSDRFEPFCEVST